MPAHSGVTTGRKPSRKFSSKHLLAASCILVGAQALVLGSVGSRTPGPLLSQLIQLTLGLICILACLNAFRQSRGVARYAWRLLAVTFVIWAFAQALGIYLDVSGNHSLDSLDETAFFLSQIPFGMLLFLDPDGEPNHFDRLHILDFVQVCVFWTSTLLCFSPRLWSPAIAPHIGHFTWSRTIAFDGLLAATFVLRALLTNSKAVRSFFGCMAIFLILSGLADSYALSPGHDLPPGGWFDLIWSALLAIPILIAATWKNADEDHSDVSARSQRVVVNQLFPLLYPLLSFIVLARVDRAYPLLSPLVFTVGFGAFASRVLIIQRRLGESENKYRVLFEDSADANWLMDEKRFLNCNSAALKMFGYASGAEMRHPAYISPPNQPDGTPSPKAIEQRIAAVFLNGKERFEWLHQRKNGNVFPAEVCLTALTLSGRPALLATVRDITQRKESEETLLFKTALLEAQAETTIDGIVVVDGSNHIVLANKQFGLHFGIPDEVIRAGDDLIVRNHVIARVEAPDAFVERVQYLYSHRDEKSRDEIKLKNGKVFDRYSAPLVDSQSGYRGRIWYFRDITDHKLAEERVQFLAYYDALTGLPNRTLLQDRLAKALAAARRQKHKVAVLFLDIDRFKDINDSLGHSVGDLLLRKIAERLKTWGREQDTVARLSGDEFVITLTHVKDVPDAAVATERLMDALTAEFIVDGQSLSIGCSVGISLFPEHGTDCETLIKNADAAMYSAKNDGRNNVRFFNEDTNAQVVERLTLENSLRTALSKKQLFLMYQPQMDIATGRIIGLEALLRWQHPTLGLVPPDKFIQIAENCGLIVSIGEWVLRTACSQAREWQREGFLAVRMAVNVSAVQFRQEGFCELIRRVLQETGLPPQYLELELTESLLLANAELMLSVVQKLKAMGLTLAIDDFGTGYSSFSYLKQFRVNRLKIDRSFIQDVAVNTDDAAITAAIISMGKSLRLTVIAEGVENEAQMSFLRTHQCDEIQGYYFSKPLAVDKVAGKLRGDSSESRAERMPVGDNRDHKLHEVRISLRSIAIALLVSADPVTIQQFSLALQELSISPDTCKDAASAGLLLKRRKFDAVIVDLQLGEQSGLILDEAHLSASNRTAVSFGISNSDAEATAAFRKKAQFVFERPLSPQSIHKILNPAYGLILRERRRYFRCPISLPVIIQREGRREIRCNSVNISGGGMALSTQVPLVPGENVRVQFTLPDHEAPVLAESTICWSKTGHLGVRFVSVADDHNSELQAWLSHELEQILPEFVADQFRKAETGSK
jgi:diguanylate cyclase (GGDEF)-like protein/PAS domain S-box-containing protein